jgi:alpha-L-fucosidase 2
MGINSWFKSNKIKSYSIILIIGICFFPESSAQNIDWPKFVAGSDLVWAEKIDTNFYNGAFIGDGVQGAMIMQDNKNPDGIRMLIGHYKNLAHNIIPGLEYCDSRVYAGNIVISPVGKASSQTMRLNIWDGEANGVITTVKGKIKWRAFADRKYSVFVVVMTCENGETKANLGVREEWGITPVLYMGKTDISSYTEFLPPKPYLIYNGQAELVIQKMKKSGAHVVASRLVKKPDNTQSLYVAVSADDNNDPEVAAANASADAIARVQSAVNEGETEITLRHREWWHNYTKSSYLEIKQDPYWQKFWWLQLYKFASASSESSGLLIDTQGPWIWECAWATVFWNLNIQLSYYPMYSSNKLKVGQSLIKGIDRIYKSGAFRANAGDSPGITVSRTTTYEGKGTWTVENGNLTWTLHNYWKYWRYSGNDTIGRSLFPMLKDNVDYLISKLEKDNNGVYHMKPSLSPEYSKDLHKDANYGLMSLRWALQTLLSMDKELDFNDPQRVNWQEKLDNLVEYPTDVNGLRVDADQGFDISHRHYSHLLAIYPYHILTTTQGEKEKELIMRSVDRWQSLTGAHAGYTYTGGCAMYATLNDGNKALTTLDKLKSKLHPNTMYSEGGGPVIETPLSAVESINYMMIQSWDDIIRIFQAVPSRWKNITFKNFRTQGAFLLSASWNDSKISNVKIFSEKGKTCNILNPWKRSVLIVRDDSGLPINTIKSGEIYSFSTKIGKTYTIKPL